MSWFEISTMGYKVEFAGEAQLQGIIFPIALPSPFVLCYTQWVMGTNRSGSCAGDLSLRKSHRVLLGRAPLPVPSSPGCTWGCPSRSSPQGHVPLQLRSHISRAPALSALRGGTLPSQPPLSSSHLGFVTEHSSPSCAKIRAGFPGAS